jgi:hypothetical protein
MWNGENNCGWRSWKVGELNYKQETYTIKGTKIHDTGGSCFILGTEDRHFERTRVSEG